jgi:hypothetical protein
MLLRQTEKVLCPANKYFRSAINGIPDYTKTFTSASAAMSHPRHIQFSIGRLQMKLPK